MVLGVGLLHIKTSHSEDKEDNAQRKPTKGRLRLLHIIIGEAAHLIWVLRCEKVIQEKTHSPDSIKRRWLDKIQRKFDTDWVIASKLDR